MNNFTEQNVFVADEGQIKLRIERLEVGTLGTNCYIVENITDGEMLVIDPGGSYPLIKQAISRQQEVSGSRLVMILNTHGHWDHVFANADVLADYPEARLLISEADAPFLSKDTLGMVRTLKPTQPDGFLIEGMELYLGSLPITVFETPGHSKGGVSFYIADKFLFAGDTLFRGSIGRTDFPGGSFKAIIESIRTKLMPLCDDVVVLPGHGGTSTIGYERKNNMFLR